MFDTQYLINEVNRLLIDGWIVDDAITGICEGHELPIEQERMLREHFKGVS